MAGEERLGGLLREARERGFVGRDEELACFDDALSGASATRVVVVTGAGGIGKTTLLEAYAARAARAGKSVVYVDARDVTVSARAVAEELARRAEAAGCAEDEEPDVLLVDGCELLAPVGRWFRDQVVATRPATSVTVMAGREAPPTQWRLDPGWRQLVAVLELGSLDRHQSADLLAGLGVPEEHRDAVATLGRGHPLALAMLAEACAGGTPPPELSAAPDVVARLCRLLVDDVPDAAHRAGLATCAHATRMTHDLLVHTVGSRADEVWAWLESRPYVRRGTVGLFLHDLVREVFEAELRQRAPEAYADLHRAVRAHFLQQLGDARQTRPDRAAAEILLLHRHGPLADHAASLRSGGLLPISRASAEEHDAILRLVEEGEGPRSAELARRWLRLQPHGVYRARSEEGVEAFAAQVYVVPEDQLAQDDPVTAAILRTVDEQGPLRPGERVNVNRFAGASAAYSRHPMVLLVNGVSCVLEWAREPAAWSWIVTTDAEFYGDYFVYLGMAPLVSLDQDGHRVVGYGWDRRRLPPSAFFELMARRELTGETGPPPPDLLRPPPLSRAAFASAVRDALGQLARPDRLTTSPLTASGLVDPAAPDRVAALREVLTSAIGGLGAEPKGDAQRRVLERTYLRGAPSQEAAAELLDLPFSTYRRHLARAQERLVEVLWALEAGGQGVSSG